MQLYNIAYHIFLHIDKKQASKQTKTKNLITLNIFYFNFIFYFNLFLIWTKIKYLILYIYL